MILMLDFLEIKTRGQTNCFLFKRENSSTKRNFEIICEAKKDFEEPFGYFNTSRFQTTLNATKKQPEFLRVVPTGVHSIFKFISGGSRERGREWASDGVGREIREYE